MGTAKIPAGQRFLEHGNGVETAVGCLSLWTVSCDNTYCPNSWWSWYLFDVPALPLSSCQSDGIRMLEGDVFVPGAPGYDDPVCITRSPVFVASSVLDLFPLNVGESPLTRISQLCTLMMPLFKGVQPCPSPQFPLRSSVM